jgi:hypothetical protein
VKPTRESRSETNGANHGNGRLARRLRHLIADPMESRSVGTYLRSRRWDIFRERFPKITEMRVIDLGGTALHWQTSPLRPASVVVVNLVTDSSPVAWINTVQGDACELPPELGGCTFDLVYSNSLIEHVGGHSHRSRFAQNVRSLAPHHWVQTPYRYFPIEPHWLFPGLQFLPQCARAAAIRHWPLSPVRPDPQEALRDVLEVELLSKTEMEFYFDQSEIVHERVLGITKSLIAVA